MKAKADWTCSSEWALLAQLTQGGGSGGSDLKRPVDIKWGKSEPIALSNG